MFDHENYLKSYRDLSDINKSRLLNRDAFTVALHLIQEALAGNGIPKILPETLIPPSLSSSGSHSVPVDQSREQRAPGVSKAGHKLVDVGSASRDKDLTHP